MHQCRDDGGVVRHNHAICRIPLWTAFVDEAVEILRTRRSPLKGSLAAREMIGRCRQLVGAFYGWIFGEVGVVAARKRKEAMPQKDKRETGTRENWLDEHTYRSPILFTVVHPIEQEACAIAGGTSLA